MVDCLGKVRQGQKGSAVRRMTAGPWLLLLAVFENREEFHGG